MILNQTKVIFASATPLRFKWRQLNIQILWRKTFINILQLTWILSVRPAGQLEHTFLEFCSKFTKNVSCKKQVYTTLRNRIPQTPAQTNLLLEHWAEPRPMLGPRLGPGRAQPWKDGNTRRASTNRAPPCPGRIGNCIRKGIQKHAKIKKRLT